MKILCIIDSFGRGGGAQTQLARLSVLLRVHGEQVEALSYHYRSPERSFQEELEREQVEYVCLAGAKNKYSKLVGIAREIKRCHPDFVVAYLGGPAIIGCLIRLFNADFRLIVSERSVTQKLRMWEKIKFFLYRKADAIVTNSYTQQQFIREHFGQLKGKLYTITNCVDINYFTPLSRTRLDSDSLHLVVVARITEGKNMFRFLDALKIVVDKGADIVVDWWGLIYPEYYEKCVEKTKSLGLSDVIQFHNSTKEVKDIYQKADVFCLPSLWEGCPNTICEAMACGLPVLCSRVCDNPLLVEDGKNGFLFDPYSVENIADVLLRFIQLPEEDKDEMRGKSRKMAMEKFSDEVFVRKYLDVFEKIDRNDDRNKK